MTDKYKLLILKKGLKITGWILAIFLFILISTILIIRIPFVQNRLTQKAIVFLKNKIGTEVRLRNIFISFPKKIVLEGLYMEDQAKDTLLFIDRLSIDTDLWALKNKTIELNSIKLSHSKAFISRQKIESDSSFNFQYIIEAFADSTVTENIGSPWKFIVDDLLVEEVLFSFKDELSGNDFEAALGSLVIKMENFDPTQTIYNVKSLAVKNSRISLIQKGEDFNSKAKADNANPASYDVDVDIVSVENVQVFYSNSFLQQHLKARIGELEIDSKHIDLVKHLIDIDKIALHHSFISYSQHGEEKDKNEAKAENEPISFALVSDWNFRLNRLQLSDNGIQYDDFSKPIKENVFDTDHLKLNGLQLDASDLSLTKEGIQASIASLTLNEENGMSIQSLKGELAFSDTSFEISRFHLRTQHSNFDLQANGNFKSLAELLENGERAQFKLRLHKSTIGLKDVLYFVPSLLDSVPIHLPESAQVLIDSQLQGSLDNLTISHLNMEVLNTTSVALHGSVKGLLDFERAEFNARIDKFYTSKDDIERLLPDSLMPASIQLPNWIQLAGDYKGTIRKPQAHLFITSDAGQLEIIYKSISGSLPGYDVAISTTQLEIGQILRQKEIGRVDLNASIKGSGIRMDSIDADIDVHVKKFQYSNYDYQNFALKGSLRNYFFTGSATLKDENLDFELMGDFDYRGKVPHYIFKFDLLNADFQALHLSDRPLKAKATLNIDLATSDMKLVNGTMGIRNVAIYNGKALYRVDSLLFASIDQKGESELSIRSDILSGDFKGTFNVFEMPLILKQHINHYFSLQDTKVNDFTEPQKFAFALTLKNTDLLTDIIFPDLHSFVPGRIQGEFDSEENKLALSIEIAKIKYATMSLDSFSIDMDSDNDALRYAVRFNKLEVDTFRISALSLSGRLAHDSIQTKLIVLDSLNKEKYILGGLIRSMESDFRYNFLPGQIMLNYKNWTTPVDNFLQVGSSGIVAHNFSLSTGIEKVAVSTNTADSTVSLDFVRWELSNLTKLIDGIVPANGEVNGNLKFTTARKGEFYSTLLINELVILERVWGDATFSVSHELNRYTLGLTIKGEHVDIESDGFFKPDVDKSTFDVDLNLSSFDLSLVEPLLFDQFNKVKGFLKGKLTISGNVDEPSIRGALTFQEASFLSTYLNNSFSLKNETISFQDEGIVFDNFKLSDQQNDVATIKGAILTAAYKDFDFDLRLTSKNFQLLNTTSSDNTLYYGNLNVESNARITGNINQPSINGAIKIGEGSQLTYVVPSEEKSALEQKGIVQFIDVSIKGDPFFRNLSLQDTTQTLFRGMDVDATIELTDKATLNIVIDPATGDRLSLKGNSTLVYTSEASGNTTLSGRYEITSGTYNFSFYKLVKREFDIVKGSAITWSGDPLNASMDLRALYRVETSPLDLVYNQISTTNQNEINSYNQRLPFLVYMNIKGRLLVPEISFALDMPDDKRNVFGGAIYSKLQDINTRESDLNKQVFALLILKRFIAENPFESQAASGIGNTARVSVSRLLSEQLNRLSQSIKGIQLNFDLKSYESNTGTEVQGQTKLQLGVSKNLFKGRLVVKLAGNVDIEGQDANQKDISEYVGDLALEYKLTSDGRFRVTGFRNSNYDMIDGELTETGAGLIYIKDYNSFQELFRSNAKTN